MRSLLFNTFRFVALAKPVSARRRCPAYSSFDFRRNHFRRSALPG